MCIYHIIFRIWYLFMKRIVFVFLAIISLNCAAAENPFFGADNDNQIALNFGYGVNQGFLLPPPTQFVPFMIFNAQYSQPTTFFRLPARQSINIAQTLGSGKKYGWNWDKYTIPIIYLSEDAILFNLCNWYFSAGIGMGLQAQQNARIGSKLLFQFKLALGYKFTEQIGGELYVQHFSNANTAPENNSYAFFGLGITYSF